MSQSDGLEKLTKFLQQTKLQAENAIDCLNIRIKELENENEITSQLAEKYLEERDYYKSYAEQLKVENSKKWRLQERDDWKALVESVQRDRSRLQDECNNLEHQLLLAREEIVKLKETIEENQEPRNDNSYEEDIRNKSITTTLNHPPTASVNETTSIENFNDGNIPLNDITENENIPSVANNQTLNISSTILPSTILTLSPSDNNNNNNNNNPILSENNNENDVTLQLFVNTPELTIDGNTPDESLRIESQLQYQNLSQNINRSISYSPSLEILKSDSVESNQVELTTSALPPPLPPSSPSFPDNLPPVPQSPYTKLSTPQSSNYHQQYHKPDTPRSSITITEQYTPEHQLSNPLNQQVKDLTFELNKTKEELNVLNQSSEAIRKSQEEEINCLREDMEVLLTLRAQCNICIRKNIRLLHHNTGIKSNTDPHMYSLINTQTNQLVLPSNPSSNIVQSNSIQTITPQPLIISQPTEQTTTSLWPTFNIFSYFFSTSSSSTGNSQTNQPGNLLTITNNIPTDIIQRV